MWAEVVVVSDGFIMVDVIDLIIILKLHLLDNFNYLREYFYLYQVLK